MGTRAVFGQHSLPMFEEIPDVLGTSIVAAILEERPIHAAIVEANVSYGLERKLKEFHNYAANTYHYGLPSGNVPAYAVDIPAITAILSGLPENAGETVTNVQGVVDTNTLVSQTYQAIQELYPSFTSTDPKIDITLGNQYDASKHDITDGGDIRNVVAIKNVVHPSDPTQSYTGIWVESKERDDREYYQSTYIGDGEYLVTQHNILIHTIPIIEELRSYIVTYEWASKPGETRHWAYAPVTGEDDDIYPELAFTEELDTIDSGYFPIVPIRLDTNSMGFGNLSATSPEYTTSKELLDIVNINLDDLVSQVDSNPDIADIDDVFLVFAANLYSDEPVIHQYLWHQFDAIYNEFPYDALNFYDVTNVDNHLYNSYAIKEDDFIQEFKFNFIRKNLVESTATEARPVGSYWVEIDHQNPEFYKTGRILTQNNDNQTQYPETIKVEQSVFKVYQQNSSKTAIEIRVHGLQQDTKARSRNGKYTKQLIQGLSTDPDEQVNLNMPLSRNVLASITNTDDHTKDKIIYASMRLNIISAIYVKTRWYDGILKALSSTVFQIFLAIVTLGGSTVWTTTLSALAAGTISLAAAAWAISIFVIKKLLIKTLIDYALEWIAKTIGGTIGIIINAIIVAYTTVFNSGGADKLKGILGIPGSQEFLLAVGSIQRAIGEFVKDEFRLLEEDYKVFSLLEEEAQSNLEAAEALLDNQGNFYNPLYEGGNDVRFIAGENPTDFYQRTVHTSNPGVLTLDTIGYYVENALTLPTNEYIN